MNPITRAHQARVGEDVAHLGENALASNSGAPGVGLLAFLLFAVAFGVFFGPHIHRELTK